MGSFRITSGKGVHFTFDNGYTISTQMGPMNYCQNYNNSDCLPRNSLCIDLKSKDCEIAIWDKKEEWVTGDILEKFNKSIVNDGEIAGYIDFNTWFKLMKFVENLE